MFVTPSLAFQMLLVAFLHLMVSQDVRHLYCVLNVSPMKKS
jgi:hypothetical protein